MYANFIMSGLNQEVLLVQQHATRTERKYSHADSTLAPAMKLAVAAAYSGIVLTSGKSHRNLTLHRNGVSRFKKF